MSQQREIEMVSLEIDGREVTVPKGTFVLHAAKQVGIEIPNFCQYPDLRPFGACRTCMVEIQTRRSTIDISCSTPASDGMKVFTRSPKVLEAQRFAVEALLVDHPLDCPICDKSGECELQNHAYFTNVRVQNPLARPKMSWELEMLSESVSIKRDRCVLCGRCVRVCDEMVGATALAWAERGHRSYIDTAYGVDLKDSPCVSCGLCIEVCPVGALLNTSYHDTARAWFLKKTETVCTFCGVGCSMQLHVEEETGRIKRIVGSQDTGINNEQLCARGYFGFEFVQGQDRLTVPLMRKSGSLVESSWEEALGLVAERLPRYRGDAFAGVAGAHCTNEENYLFGKLVRGVMGSPHLDHDAGQGRGARARGLRDVWGTDAATNGFLDVFENARCVLVLGSNLSATHPVFSYKLQTAVRRRGIALIVASPEAVPLSQIADIDLRYREGSEAALVNGLAALVDEKDLVARDWAGRHTEGLDRWRQAAAGYTAEGVAAVTGVPAELLERAAELYATGGGGQAGEDGLYPPSALVYSAGLVLREGGERIDYGAAALALLTGNVGRSGAGVLSLKVANNGQGAVDMGCVPWALPGGWSPEDAGAREAWERAWGLTAPIPDRPGLGLDGMLDAARAGRLRAMYVMGSNPVGSRSDATRTREALGGLEFLVVQDMFLTPTAELADVVLPACSWAEKDGTYTSAERRIQRVNKALTNYGQAIPDWTILVRLIERMGLRRPYRSTDEILAEIGRSIPMYAGVGRHELERPGTVVALRPGKVYRNPSVDEVSRLGVQWPTSAAGADGHGMPVLFSDGFPMGRARLVPVPFEPDAPIGDGVYAGTMRVSLYRQGTGTMTDRCPTLASLDENGAADSSLERGRGVGMLQTPRLKQAGYSTGQLTDI